MSAYDRLLKGLPEWANLSEDELAQLPAHELKRQMTVLDERTQELQQASDELKAIARDKIASPQVKKRLAAAGYVEPPSPDPDLMRLSSHLEAAHADAVFASRLQAIREPDEDVNLQQHVAAATARSAVHMADAQVLTLDRATFDSLPDLSGNEMAGAQRLFTVLGEEPLPWGVVWIEPKGKPHEAPEVGKVALDDTDPQGPIRWGGTLCVETELGKRLTPMVYHPKGDSLSALGEVWVLRDDLQAREVNAEGQPLGTMLWGLDDGELGWSVAPLTIEDDDSVTKFMLALATLTLAWIGATLQVLNAVNVKTEPKALGGKNAKRQRRTGHPVPHVVKVKKRGSVGGGTGEGLKLTSSHYVRGHWMHVTKGATFEGNPEARRWIPELGCPAVRIWREAHMRGPDANAVPTTRRL